MTYNISSHVPLILSMPTFNRTGVYDIPSQDIITKDSITVSVDAVVFYRVTAPMLAVCGDGDYRLTTE